MVSFAQAVGNSVENLWTFIGKAWEKPFLTQNFTKEEK